MHVAIIGAGLGGLTLAHGLRRDGVDVTVHERGPRAGEQPASYGIHLDAHGLRALHACLPAENWRAFDDAAGPARDAVRFRDPALRPVLTWDRETPADAADPVTRRRGVRRDDLRDALLAGLADDGTVRFDERFVGYEHRGSAVRARFADGGHVDADLLVGADGAGSRVRAQRLPGVDRADLGVVAIAGRRTLDADLDAALPGDLTDGSVNNVLPAGPGWFFTATWRTGTAAPQVVWAWTAARAALPGDVETVSGERLRALVGERIAGWSPALRALVAGTDPGVVAPIALRTMPPIAAWPAGPVTLCGDAAHAMSPLAGIGATTALRDAETLRRALAGRADPVAAVADYERRMRAYANRALATSTRNARTAASRSLVARTAFRTLLGVADAVPVVKNRLFPEPVAR